MQQSGPDLVKEGFDNETKKGLPMDCNYRAGGDRC